jgi:hypothetical protein
VRIGKVAGFLWSEDVGGLVKKRDVVAVVPPVVRKSVRFCTHVSIYKRTDFRTIGGI